MLLLKYSALDKYGKQINETIRVNNFKKFSYEIKSRGLRCVKIERIEKEKVYLLNRRFSARVLSELCYSLGTLTSSGILPDRALKIEIDKCKNLRLKKVLNNIYKNINGGYMLSQALKEQKSFPELMIYMIESGEASGNVSGAFENLAKYFGREHNIKSKITGAFSYPLFLMTTLLTVCIIIFTFVLPGFLDALIKNDIELPIITKSVLFLANIIKSGWHIFLSFIAVLYLIVKLFLQEKFNSFISLLQIHIPVLKEFILIHNYAQFSQALLLLTKGGITLSSAIPIAVKTIFNKYIASDLENFGSLLTTGKNISDSSGKIRNKLTLVNSMFIIGESTGDFSSIIEQTADYLAKDEENALRRFISFIEPSLIILSALIIAYVILSIYLPLIYMYDTL